MTTTEQYEQLLERYVRLCIAVRGVLDAADYDGEDARIYKHQLADLRRELEGKPQPNGLKFMSIS
jgi:hypothetical protein